MFLTSISEIVIGLTRIQNLFPYQGTQLVQSFSGPIVFINCQFLDSTTIFQ